MIDAVHDLVQTVGDWGDLMRFTRLEERTTAIDQSQASRYAGK
jgi:hypothetical protein